MKEERKGKILCDFHSFLRKHEMRCCNWCQKSGRLVCHTDLATINTIKGNLRKLALDFCNYEQFTDSEFVQVINYLNDFKTVEGRYSDDLDIYWEWDNTRQLIQEDVVNFLKVLSESFELEVTETGGEVGIYIPTTELNKFVRKADAILGDGYFSNLDHIENVRDHVYNFKTSINETFGKGRLNIFWIFHNEDFKENVLALR
ncbi:MAG: hypothetical protein CL489_10560 [Acidobacteria bacterium]|nr:hypothetical protein [Acidobacteriota bacterium]|tara:strand:- start:1949 stop:2554 length:606 start_codon:yes stop_codon:yes gene_type:complete